MNSYYLFKVLTFNCFVGMLLCLLVIIMHYATNFCVLAPDADEEKKFSERIKIYCLKIIALL